MKLLDLFSGIGGFSLAARWAGIETIQFVENNKFCQKVLAKNFPNVPIHSDIKTFKQIEHVDLITAGFPCQGFSIAGKRKGINDPRYLWPDTLRIIQEVKPHWFIGENVTGIVAMELDNILFDLEKEGYETSTFILPACAANAHHRRDRIWIIANSNSKRCINGVNNRETGCLQENKEWNMAALQSEWAQFKPLSWSTFKARNWFTVNAEISRKADGISQRLDEARIKALGNSIVPQVVYPILKSIMSLEHLYC